MSRENDEAEFLGEDKAGVSEEVQRTREQLKDELVEQQRRLQQLEMAKKQIVKRYNSDISDVKDEIAGIMMQLQ